MKEKKQKGKRDKNTALPQIDSLVASGLLAGKAKWESLGKRRGRPRCIVRDIKSAKCKGRNTRKKSEDEGGKGGAR